MKNIENNNPDKSIGFFETIEILILYKINILIFFIIFFLLSLTYVSFSNKGETFLTEYSIASITGLESKNLNKLNFLVNEIQASRLIKQTLVISGTNIIEHDSIFKENILYGSLGFALEDGSQKLSLIPRITIKDLFNHFFVLFNSLEIQEKVNNQFLKKYPNENLPVVHVRAIKITEFGTPFFHLKIYHSDKKIIDDYSEILFKQTKEAALNIVKENIQQTKLFFLNNKQKALESLKSQNIVLRIEFKNKMKEIVLNLQEQAVIARKMELSMPPELSQTENVLSRLPFEYSSTDSPTSTAMIFNSSANYNYLRGYISLEEEINLIKKRTKAEDFVPIIRSNLQAINKLEDDEFGSAQIAKLNQYDVSLLDFYNVVVSQSKVQKTYMSFDKNIFVLILSLCGIILGIMFSIFQYSYKKYKLLDR